MKLKLDEKIPSTVAEFLREPLFDVDTVLEESLGGSDDRTVLEAARAEGRMLITLDRGFGDVRSYPPGSHPGIVGLRPDDQRVPTVLRSVEMLVEHHDLASLAGCISVIQRNVLRVRWPSD